METKYYEEIDDFFDDLSLGDELVIVRSVNNSNAKNYGRVKSIKPSGIKVQLKDGEDYKILIDAYNEQDNSLKIIHGKKQTIKKLVSIKELYAVLKYRDDDTGKITKVLGKYNPNYNRTNRAKQQQDDDERKAPYEEYVSIANEDDIVYTDRQKESLIKNLDEIKEVIENLEDGDIVYIYQAQMMDYPSAVKDFWEDWIDEHGNDTESIKRAYDEAPTLNDMYDQDNVNRISFTVEVDNNGNVYVKKPIDHTSKNNEFESYIKSGHHFTSDNFILDEDDYTKNVGLYGKYSLEVDSIFDIKKTSGDEDDPDYHEGGEENSNEPMTDAEIMKMIANDKQMMNFLTNKPSFLDFIRSGGKSRNHKPFTQSHLRLFKNAIDGYENGENRNSKKYHNATIVDLGGSAIGEDDSDILVNQSIIIKGYAGRGGKTVTYVYNENRKLLGKIFTKDSNIYDSDIDEFETNEISGEFKNKKGKTHIKIKID